MAVGRPAGLGGPPEGRPTALPEAASPGLPTVLPKAASPAGPLGAWASPAGRVEATESSTGWGLGKREATKRWAARWRGPAVVMGLEANNFWQARRDLTIRASCRRLRPADASEAVDWKGIFERVPDA